MKQQFIHNSISAVDIQSKRFFTGGEFDWSKSEASLWAELSGNINKTPTPNASYKLQIIQWSVAATFALLIGIAGFMRFYSKTVVTPDSIHLAINLPDGSLINLNARSSLQYHPYWWRIERKVTFEGEGYFEVEKGNRFTVISRLGATQVMGTSFNIYSRDEIYKVTCVTGRVKVISKTQNEVILNPDNKATVKPNGQINLFQNIETLPEISWRENNFLFTSVPVDQVFAEIERQYGITINARVDDYTLYTGNFSRNQQVEEILGYICPALGYKFIRKSEKAYSIIQDKQ